jgi:hypothetical protein
MKTEESSKESNQQKDATSEQAPDGCWRQASQVASLCRNSLSASNPSPGGQAGRGEHAIYASKRLISSTQTKGSAHANSDGAPSGMAHNSHRPQHICLLHLKNEGTIQEGHELQTIRAIQDCLMRFG